MKLLLWAILAESLIDIEVRQVRLPNSLESKTGSACFVVSQSVNESMLSYVQLGCFQFMAVHMFRL